MKYVTETIEACTIIKSRSFCSTDIDYYKCIFFFYKLKSNRSLKKYIAYVLKGMCDGRTHFIYFKYSRSNHMCRFCNIDKMLEYWDRNCTINILG